ncbi:MAG: hypothetical protein K9J12_07065 [Melioribacteraceae bacterium]|nr:hypothetical protein [Melioribacteraceae bacterium]
MKIRNYIIQSILLLFSCAQVFAQAETSQISSRPGAFSRLGFGARGISLGNAMAATNTGNLVSYYNPALASFQEDIFIGTGYSFLSLDRSMNFLNVTKKFEFGKKPGSNSKPRSVAGLSFGIINSGVSEIEERDNQGTKSGSLSTSENLIYLGLSNKFSEKFSLGVSFKFYYYSLYEDISTTGFGMDLGAIYSFSDNLKFAIVLRDVNSKYRWDTTELYGQSGNTYEEKFPLSKVFAASYFYEEYKLSGSVEWESSNAGTSYLRMGLEAELNEFFILRGGFDRLDISNSDTPIRPSAGFAFNYSLGGIKTVFEYAFSIEPYSSFDKHIIGLGVLL